MTAGGRLDKQSSAWSQQEPRILGNVILEDCDIPMLIFIGVDFDVMGKHILYCEKVCLPLGGK